MATAARQITRGPKHHWFGYYDKLQFDPADRYVLAMEVDFERRSPTPDDVIQARHDRSADGDRWIEIGTLAGLELAAGLHAAVDPGIRSREILWNDRQGDRFVCPSFSMSRPASVRTLPHARLLAVSPDGRSAVTPDFRRTRRRRPGYGYAGLADPFAADVAARKQSGIWTHVDLATGAAKL